MPLNFEQIRELITDNLTQQGVSDRITAAELREVTEAIVDKLEEAGEGGAGGGLISVSYEELQQKIADSELIAGQMYLLTDFRTIHYMVNGFGDKIMDGDDYQTNTGEAEPLILTAASENSLDKNAISTVYPQDIIHYSLTESEWVDDNSFGDGELIIDGFRGVINFRHDTLLDNSMGYDFRQVKFRRWKTNAPDWDEETVYGQNAWVKYNGRLYRSKQGSNEGNVPAANAQWFEGIDISRSEYILAANSHNGLVRDENEYIDVHTFAEGEGTATYERCARSNHFDTFKDNMTDWNGYMASILPNNVIYLLDWDWYTFYGNNFGEFCEINTFMGYAEGIRPFFFFTNNIIGEDFYNNQVGNSFQNNHVGDRFQGNQFGDRFQGNQVGNSFQNNQVGNNFQNNQVGNNFQVINSLAWVRVYQGYAKEIIRSSGGTWHIRYIDNSGVQQIVLADDTP